MINVTFTENNEFLRGYFMGISLDPPEDNDDENLRYIIDMSAEAKIMTDVTNHLICIKEKHTLDDYQQSGFEFWLLRQGIELDDSNDTKILKQYIKDRSIEPIFEIGGRWEKHV